MTFKEFVNGAKGNLLHVLLCCYQGAREVGLDKAAINNAIDALVDLESTLIDRNSPVGKAINIAFTLINPQIKDADPATVKAFLHVYINRLVEGWEQKLDAYAKGKLAGGEYEDNYDHSDKNIAPAVKTTADLLFDTLFTHLPISEDMKSKLRKLVEIKLNYVKNEFWELFEKHNVLEKVQGQLDPSVLHEVPIETSGGYDVHKLTKDLTGSEDSYPKTPITPVSSLENTTKALIGADSI